MAITQIIATLPAVLNDSATFYEDIAERNNTLVVTTLPTINTWATQANALQAEINTTAAKVAAASINGGYSQTYINTNFVGVNNAQNITAIKTFTVSPIVPNATTATQAMAYGQGVNLTGSQAIAGVKTFSSSPIVPTPTAGTQAVNKTYADLKVALTDFTGANQNLTQNGYQKLPGGLIIQWGRYNGTLNDAYADITFPIQFPNAVYSLTATSNTTTVSAGSDFRTAGVYINNTSSFRLFGYGGGASVTETGYYWFAIGK